MSREPLPCQIDHLIEGAGLLEQMRRAGHDLEAFLALQLGKGLLVQVQYADILSAHNEQRRRPYLAEHRASRS